MNLLEQFWDFQNPDPILIDQLRELLVKCGAHPDAGEAVCYHGALALISEVEHKWSDAIKHRETEIAKIEELHKLEMQNPTDGAALVDYEVEVLAKRYAILDELKVRSVL